MPRTFSTRRRRWNEAKAGQYPVLRHQPARAKSFRLIGYNATRMRSLYFAEISTFATLGPTRENSSPLSARSGSAARTTWPSGPSGRSSLGARSVVARAARRAPPCAVTSPASFTPGPPAGSTPPLRASRSFRLLYPKSELLQRVGRVRRGSLFLYYSQFVGGVSPVKRLLLFH